MYELLLSADFMVPDPDALAAALDERLGVHTHPRWRQAFPNHPYIAWFLRVHKSLAVAPTRLEPQGHLDKPNLGDPFFPAHLDGLMEFQGRFRPIKTHSTVLVARDIGALADRLMRRRLPFRIAPITDEMPFDRLWVGVTPDNPRYEPSVDGGLCIEVIPLQPLQFPDDAFSDPPPQPRDPAPGELARVTARGYLVRHLDDTLRRLSTNLDLEPTGPVEHFSDEGFRRARIRFALPHSASLDVIEPTRWDSEPGRYLHNWGPGPYYTRISACGLDAKAKDLESRGTPFSWLEESDSLRGRGIRVDPSALGGALIELVEHESRTAS
jgi:hypothetical protein